MRPMAWESEEMMEMAPMSCRMSSAAMVSPRIRDSANATSSGMLGSRWWQTMSMSRCSSMVFTVKGRVGFVDDGSTLGSPQTLMMSGAWPPPAPSEWYVWIVRPLIAASESSTKPDSFSVSVWIVMATSCSSANVKHASMAAGVVPQSSWSLNPAAPAFNTSFKPPGSDALPLPLNPKFSGRSSVALSIISTSDGAGVHVVAHVPDAGPVPPPYMVVSPDATASSHCCGQMKWMCVSTPPAVKMSFSPAMASVVTPTVMPGVTPSMTSGFPALPMPTMRFPFKPTSALTTPKTASTMSALVMTVSNASAAAQPVCWPMPSRKVLPPPNLHSSP
mmetsp:Transcript_16012/g.48116  ORF Transcript_16012/g.48116 Transcript_16012/m.48116 type:complete len:333 (-) Transcript_16012:528-1526(-)